MCYVVLSVAGGGRFFCLYLQSSVYSGEERTYCFLQTANSSELAEVSNLL